MEKADEIVVQWNKFVGGFYQSFDAWKTLNGLLNVEFNPEDLDCNMQKYLDMICRASRFRFTVESLMQYMGLNNDFNKLLVKPKVKETKKEK